MLIHGNGCPLTEVTTIIWPILCSKSEKSHEIVQKSLIYHGTPFVIGEVRFKFNLLTNPTRGVRYGE